MKSSQFKTIIKEAVREAIQEELKDILLEAIKTPKVITQQTPVSPITEVTQVVKPAMSAEDKREAYQNILGDTAAAFTSNNAQSFKPQEGMDVANGTLPAGEVDMSQIMNLMSK